MKRSHRIREGQSRRNGKHPARARLLVLSPVLAAGAAGGWFGLVYAREHGEFGALLGLGLLVLVLALASVVSLALIAIDAVRRRPAPFLAEIRSVGVPHEDYVARYSASSRIVALVLACFWCMLTLVQFVRLGGEIRSFVPLLLWLASTWYAVHVVETSVRFTNEHIIARLPGFRKLTEPYAAIVELRSKLGTIQIQFADGRSLKLHSGLGNPNRVIGYLRTHCPKSVEQEDSRWPLA